MGEKVSPNQSVSQRLAGKVAIVTGAGKGLGRSICIELAREGADVAIVAGHDPLQAQDVAAEIKGIGSRALPLLADVTHAGVVSKMVEDAAAYFGRVDILVNNAGVPGIRKPLVEIQEQDWDRIFAVNAKGTFLCSAATARLMIQQKSGGSIINIASASAHRSYPDKGPYGASKAAVVNFTRQASIEWAAYGIRVNGVSPGPIQEDGTNWQQQQRELAKKIALLPIARAASRWEVARAVVYLASADAGYITGQMIIIDGGAVNTWYLSADRGRRSKNE